MTSQGSVVRPLERDDETGFDLFCEENGAISGMAARPTERVTESWGSLDMAPPQRVGGGRNPDNHPASDPKWRGERQKGLR